MVEDTATSTSTTNTMANSGAFDAAPAPPPEQQMMPASAELTPPSPAAQPAPILSGLQPATQPPPAAGTPSVWKNIVMGAIYGLAGSGGAKTFGAGAGGGAASVLAQEQLQKENAARQAAQQADVQFKSVQAAHMIAETAVLNRQLSTMDEDHQQKVFDNGLESMKSLQSMGFTPYSITDDAEDEAGGSAHAAMKDATNKLGGVPATLSVPLGPHKWAHFNLQQGAQTGTAIKIINDFNSRFGQPTVQGVAPPKPGSAEEQAQIKTAKDDWDLLHTPTSDDGELQNMQNKLALVQSLPDDTPYKKDTIGLLTKNIETSKPLAQSVKDKANQAAANKAKSQKQAEIDTETSPANVAAQAKLAGAKSSAEASAKAAADTASGEWKPKVTADEKKKAELAENIAENATAVNAILARRPDLVGAVAGRFTNAQQMIGNNDKDISAVGNRVHNIAMANSGVHGFRSQEGVEETERNILNSFKNGPDAVKGALGSNVDSVQTFIDNARPPSYQTHSSQGGAGTYYHNKIAAPQPIYAAAPGKPRMMSTDGGKTWQTAPAQ